MEDRGYWQTIYLIMETFKGEPVKVFTSGDNGLTSFDGTEYHELAHARYFEVESLKDKHFSITLREHQYECLERGFLIGCFDDASMEIDVGSIRKMWKWEQQDGDLVAVSRC